jgi:hypothetical protein
LTSLFSWISGAEQCIYGFPMQGEAKTHPNEVMKCLDIHSNGKINTIIYNDHSRFLQLFGPGSCE